MFGFSKVKQNCSHLQFNQNHIFILRKIENTLKDILESSVLAGKKNVCIRSLQHDLTSRKHNLWNLLWCPKKKQLKSTSYTCNQRKWKAKSYREEKKKLWDSVPLLIQRPHTHLFSDNNSVEKLPKHTGPSRALKKEVNMYPSHREKLTISGFEGRRENKKKASWQSINDGIVYQCLTNKLSSLLPSLPFLSSPFLIAPTLFSFFHCPNLSCPFFSPLIF